MLEAFIIETRSKVRLRLRVRAVRVRAVRVVRVRVGPSSSRRAPRCARTLTLALTLALILT